MLKFKAEYDGNTKAITLEIDQEVFYEKREELFDDKFNRWIWRVVEGKEIHAAMEEKECYDDGVLGAVEEYIFSIFDMVDELKMEL